jgi:hypothetical protein
MQEQHAAHESISTTESHADLWQTPVMKSHYSRTLITRTKLITDYFLAQTVPKLCQNCAKNKNFRKRPLATGHSKR